MLRLPDPLGADPARRPIRLRYAGTCIRCGRELNKGVEALYDASTRKVRCIECEAPSDATTAEMPPDPGVAGSSARREYEARQSGREKRVKRRLGNLLGNVALAITDEPQSTRAWDQAARGEESLAAAPR